MAAISTYLSRIKSAVLGEEVRGSIHDAIKAINDENVTVLQSCTAAQNIAETARDDAVTAKKAAETAKADADAAKKAANVSEGNAAKSAQTAKAAEDNIDSKIAVVTEVKGNLMSSYQITDNLLDSSGDTLQDSSGRNIIGKVVLAEAGNIEALTKRVASLEMIIKTMTTK